MMKNCAGSVSFREARSDGQGFLAMSPVVLNSVVILETVEGSTYKLPATSLTGSKLLSAKQFST